MAFPNDGFVARTLGSCGMAQIPSCNPEITGEIGSMNLSTTDVAKKNKGLPVGNLKNKGKRLRQQPVQLIPQPCSAEAERGLVASLDMLLAQFAKNEVLKQLKGDQHAADRIRTGEVP
jgi:hypothetical protein